MAHAHGIPKSTVNGMILWVEHRLVDREEFKLKDLKERFKPGESEIKIVLIDVEEQPIERPKYEQKSSYSGKKNNTRQNTKS